MAERLIGPPIIAYFWLGVANPKVFIAHEETTGSH